MKLLLVALNAKYIHSNPAVHSLRSYAGKYSGHTELLELTINHSEEEVLKEIYKKKADLVAFSCYIWNVNMIKRVMPELKKVQPEVKIWLGGPEVSYDADTFLAENVSADGIVVGEGEQTFLELAEYYIDGKTRLKDIAGIAFKESACIDTDKDSREEAAQIGEKALQVGEEGLKNKVTITPERELLSLDSLPFYYEDSLQTSESYNNKIIYYESSRGCPFSCSYCLSSIDKKVRFRDTELVKRELKIFLDDGVAQVKFVDRTFNCNKKHAMEIWRFIKENDNGITNFHFEVAADLFDEEELKLLAGLRPGQVQFEIGVQTTNPDTVAAIHRKMDLDRLSRNVCKIKEGANIHVHLDLIAGLPLEDYSSFEKSFQEVYSLKPDQLQMGFLKVLKGSFMEQEAARYGIIYRSTPPYEVLSTDKLSYDEMLKIKGVCDMVEVYYNSGQFTYSIQYLEHFYASKMKLYEAISEFYEQKQYAGMAHNRIKRYEILLDFYREIVLKSGLKPVLTDLFKELLIFDLYLREDLKARPSFSPERNRKEALKALYDKYRAGKNTIHIELFRFDIIVSARTGQAVGRETAVLFDYGCRNPLNYSAGIEVLTDID